MDAADFRNLQIEFKYAKPSAQFLTEARKYTEPVEMTEQPRILIDNRYFRNGVKGSLSKIYLRSFLLKKIEEALDLIPPIYGFVIFDGYRSKETQEGLFLSYSDQIRGRFSNWSEQQVYSETRKFVAHPDEPSRFEISPHNSGGAVDISLTINGSATDLGTDFDDFTESAASDFFERPYDPQIGIEKERWALIRENRRILFHSLISVGFTNWKYEWWHFDIGNCLWSQEVKLPWFYDSMSAYLK
jgi:zinc D-Ala-D-Ala dipeptidase